MKTLIFLLALVLSVSAQEVNVTLVWDQHPEPDVAEYKVYWGAASGQYTGTANAQTNRATVALPRGMVYLAVTAINTGGFESSFSKELPYYVKAPGEIRIPSPPTGVRAPKELNSARIEKSTDLKNWFPIYHCTEPKAFFRLVVST